MYPCPLHAISDQANIVSFKTHYINKIHVNFPIKPVKQNIQVLCYNNTAILLDIGGGFSILIEI